MKIINRYLNDFPLTFQKRRGSLTLFWGMKQKRGRRKYPSKIEWDRTNGPLVAKVAIRYSGFFGVHSVGDFLETQSPNPRNEQVDQNPVEPRRFQAWKPPIFWRG